MVVLRLAHHTPKRHIKLRVCDFACEIFHKRVCSRPHHARRRAKSLRPELRRRLLLRRAGLQLRVRHPRVRRARLGGRRLARDAAAVRAGGRGGGLPGRTAAAACSGDQIPAMMQQPDIGKAIFEHTSDSHVVELPFGLGEWHLPTGWRLLGIDLSPTKHVVFMIVAALLVFLTIWYAGRQVERRHREGKAPHGFGAAVEAVVLFVRNDVAIANIGHGGEKFAPYILTLFFFILYCNLLGLLPWGATPTGNLAVTGALALTAFVT